MAPTAYAWLSAIENSAAGLLVRDAVLLYPLANVGHVVAVCVFFAAVAVMDLALLGALPGAAPQAVLARARPFAWGAFTALLVTGAVLFVPEASAIALNVAFQVKLALIVLAGLNLLVLGLALRRGFSRLARRAAILSLVVWLLVAAFGRFIAYA